MNQAPYKVAGFRLFDKVRYNGEDCFVFGRRTRGVFVLRTIDGRLVADVSVKKFKFLSVRKRIIMKKEKE